MATTMVHARIDKKVKERAAKFLFTRCLSVPEAIRLMLFWVGKTKTVPFPDRVDCPFPSHVPGAITRKAMRDAEAGRDVTYCKDLEDLWRSRLGVPSPARAGSKQSREPKATTARATRVTKRGEEKRRSTKEPS